MRLRRLIVLRIGFVALALFLAATPGPRMGTAGAVTLDDTDAVVSDLSEYWTAQLLSNGLADVAPIVIRDETSSDPDCRTVDRAATYCESDNVIYLDEATMTNLLDGWDALVGVTDLAVAWGAFLAGTLSETDGPMSVADDPIARDRFAMCAAGVYVGHLWFDFETREGDLIVAIDALDAQPYPADETTDGRVLAFMRGFVGGFSSCFDSADRTD
jgi:hypothetical protein